MFSIDPTGITYQSNNRIECGAIHIDNDFSAEGSVYVAENGWLGAVITFFPTDALPESLIEDGTYTMEVQSSSMKKLLAYIEKQLDSLRLRAEREIDERDAEQWAEIEHDIYSTLGDWVRDEEDQCS
jgi:hypothetical protein